MISRKRIAAMMLVGTMTFTMLATGCGKKEVDYNMGDNPGNNSSGDNTSAEGGLAGRLGIPASCDENIEVGNTGIQSIRLNDDEISVPKTDGMSVVYYEATKMDAAYKQKIAESLFDKEKGIYEYDYEHRIKSEIQEEIDYMKQEQANMAAQGYTDSWYDTYIAELEAQLQDAPEEYPAAEDYSGEAFIGTMNGIEFNLGMYTDEEADTNMIRASLSIRDEFSYRPNPDATNGYCYGGPSVDEFMGTNACTVTIDEAVRIAEDFMLDCGVTDMAQSKTSVMEWNYYDRESGEDIATEYDGYVITFSRMVNNTPSYQGNVWNVDNLQMENAWLEIPTEEFEVYVDDNGVIEAYWSVMFSATGEEDTNVELLSWDEVLEAANKNIPEYYEKYPVRYKKIEFNDVRLTYYPVIDETKNNSYKYIPVWVFSQYEEYIDSDESSYPTQLVIMNAMDGSVIDLVELAKTMGTYQEYTFY